MMMAMATGHRTIPSPQHLTPDTAECVPCKPFASRLYILALFRRRPHGSQQIAQMPSAHHLATVKLCQRGVTAHFSRSPRRMETVSSTLGGSTITCWKRRSRAASCATAVSECLHDLLVLDTYEMRQESQAQGQARSSTRSLFGSMQQDMVSCMPVRRCQPQWL